MAAGDVEVNLTQNNSHKAAKFDGTDDYLRCSGTDFSFSTNINFSFSFWILSKANLSAATARMLCKTKIIGGTGWFSDITNNKFRFFTLLGATYKVEMDSAVVFKDNWVHITLTCDRSSGSKIYINGSEVASTETNPANITDDMNSANELYIGKLDTQAINWFNGYIADIRVWRGKILTAAEITDIYAGTKVSDKLTSTWNFENDDYTDSHGSNNITNEGTYLSIGESGVSAAVAADRTTANDHYLIFDGLHGQVGTVVIEEAP